jgi:hypothetical protein
MRFEVKAKIISFERTRFINDLVKVADEQMRQAAREWLRAVILKVPVYTGASRGSLLPLGRYLNIAIPIHPVVRHPRWSPEVGALMQFFNFSHDLPSLTWTFQYSTQVPHYLINEFNVGLGQPPLIEPTPWRSFAAGKIAWDNYVRTEFFRRLPKISDYIRTIDLNG